MFCRCIWPIAYDYLRSHADLAKEYVQLKVKLAQEHLYDHEKYTDEKLDFVYRVLERDLKARAVEDDRVST
jgi:GrpB-like predicted nucleotidyltransferase (UPF0157 family)